MKSKFTAILAAILVAGCSTPRLPDPTVAYPTPPAALMEPPVRMAPIPDAPVQGANVADSN